MSLYRCCNFVLMLLALGAASCAGTPDSPAAVDSTATPRTAEGHPDLAGVLFPGVVPDVDSYGLTAAEHRSFDPNVTPQESPSLQRWALEKIEQMGDLERISPGLQCRPEGPTMYGLGQVNAMEIVQTPDRIVLLAEAGTTWRIIYTDGRPQEANPDPQYHGHSVGHWEDDTLVVDVVGVDPNIWIGGGSGTPGGWFVSDALHLVERWSRPDANTLNYQVTIEDPKVLNAPWTSAPRTFTYAPGKRLYEYFCTTFVDFQELNPEGRIPQTPEGNDARFWDPQEYERLRQQYPE